MSTYNKDIIMIKMGEKFKVRIAAIFFDYREQC